VSVIVTFLRRNLLWTQGYALLTGIFLLAILAWFLSWFLFLVVGIFFFFCLYFFRNPERRCPQAITDPSLIICPADGTVIALEYNPDKQVEESAYAYRISIFLSPFDVHVNWSPISGVVQALYYKPGAFMFAFLPKSSELNERNDVVVVGEKAYIMVRQIAGTLARRICWWVAEGDQLKAGQTYGMIRFGSRVDLFLPEQVLLSIKKGQRVYGGQTIVGRFVWD
jgi:phosphatidylserine decarboxylase